jgi:hypothetical protein
MWQLPENGRHLPMGRFVELDAELGLWAFSVDDGRIGWYEPAGAKPGLLVAQTVTGTRENRRREIPDP